MNRKCIELNANKFSSIDTLKEYHKCIIINLAYKLFLKRNPEDKELKLLMSKFRTKIDINELQQIIKESKKIYKKQLYLDISELVQKDAKTGIQRVVRSILMELLKNPPKEYDIQPVYATLNDDYRYATNFTNKFLGHDKSLVEDQYIECQEGDIFFLLDMQPQVQIAKQQFYKSLKSKRVEVKFLLYDLLSLTMKEYFPQGGKERFEKWVIALTTSSNGVVCISDTVAKEYISWHKKNISTDMENMTVSYFHLGGDLDNSKPSEGLPGNTNNVLEALKSKPSFTMIGTLEPRKGHKQTFQAFEQLWNIGEDVLLVIVGKLGWMMDDFKDKLNNHPQKNKSFFWLEGISDEYLQKVYELSDCIIAASEGEGFGLPLIEAAQYKKPIIARDIPIFREVAGNFAYYFRNNNSPQVLAESIKEWLKLNQDDKHPKSDNMQWLTWEESAKALMEKLCYSTEETI
ncbi:MAG: glycosyltransferase family 1 protein [Campylobacterota bacterium]|nr:glycosyltransferase family 1 protein [Campylobacterota bacterium]